LGVPLQNQQWYTLSRGTELTLHESLPLPHHGANLHGDLDQGAAVADGSSSTVAVAAGDASAISSGNADTTTSPDITPASGTADATYSANEVTLINDLVTAQTALATLANELKADYNGAVALINELKTVSGELRALANEEKADLNTLVGNVNTDAITKVNALLASMRAADLIAT